MRRAEIHGLVVYDNGEVYRRDALGIEQPAKIYNANAEDRYKMVPDGKGRVYYVHRLIAEAFVENPDGKLVVNHKDGNKRNNAASNLEWVTAGENVKHAYDTGLKDRFKHRNRRPSPGNVLKIARKRYGVTQDELAKRLGVGRTTVTMWETGANMPPTKYLVAIAEALGCTVDELLKPESA
jgi:DNA-binding XRE family transcriptional regulator